MVAFMGILHLLLQGDKWRRAFMQVAAAVGVHTQQSSEPQLDAVLAAVANLQQSELRLQVCEGLHSSRVDLVLLHNAMHASGIVHYAHGVSNSATDAILIARTRAQQLTYHCCGFDPSMCV
jgi:hypothetical protein